MTDLNSNKMELQNNFCEGVIETCDFELNTDLFYNKEDEEKIQSILDFMGFGAIANIFKEAYIDYESFINMNATHIMALFKEFPIGLAIKFELALKKWKLFALSNSQTISVSSDDDSDIQITPGIIIRLLEMSTEGKDFLSQIDRKKQFSEEQKSIFINLILKPFFKKKQQLTSRQIIELAKEIQNEFPNEQVSSYVNLNSGIGVLYNKYNYQLKILRQKRQMPESSLTFKRNLKKNMK